MQCSFTVHFLGQVYSDVDVYCFGVLKRAMSDSADAVAVINVQRLCQTEN